MREAEGVRCKCYSESLARQCTPLGHAENNLPATCYLHEECCWRPDSGPVLANDCSYETIPFSRPLFGFGLRYVSLWTEPSSGNSFSREVKRYPEGDVHGVPGQGFGGQRVHNHRSEDGRQD